MLRAISLLSVLIIVGCGTGTTVTLPTDGAVPADVRGACPFWTDAEISSAIVLLINARDADTSEVAMLQAASTGCARSGGPGDTSAQCYGCMSAIAEWAYKGL
jgi:hypothetical protein